MKWLLILVLATGILLLRVKRWLGVVLLFGAIGLAVFDLIRQPSTRDVYEQFVQDTQQVEEDAGQVLALDLQQRLGGPPEKLLVVGPVEDAGQDGLVQARWRGVRKVFGEDPATYVLLDASLGDAWASLEEKIQTEFGPDPGFDAVLVLSHMLPVSLPELAASQGPPVYFFDSTGRLDPRDLAGAQRPLGMAIRRPGDEVREPESTETPDAQARASAHYAFLFPEGGTR